MAKLTALQLRARFIRNFGAVKTADKGIKAVETRVKKLRAEKEAAAKKHQAKINAELRKLKAAKSKKATATKKAAAAYAKKSK